MVARLAPLRLGSLLMGIWFMSNAMANDFAGMLSKLYPEKYVSVSAVIAEEAQQNVKLLERKEGSDALLAEPKTFGEQDYVAISSVAFSNIKKKAARDTAFETITTDSKVQEKSFFGFKVNSLYSFFMVFVFMGGIAAIILFLLQKKLLSMMHGIR